MLITLICQVKLSIKTGQFEAKIVTDTKLSHFLLRFI